MIFLMVDLFLLLELKLWIGRGVGEMLKAGSDLNPPSCIKKAYGKVERRLESDTRESVQVGLIDRRVHQPSSHQQRRRQRSIPMTWGDSPVCHSSVARESVVFILAQHEHVVVATCYSSNCNKINKTEFSY
jgi:hypothetical protein